MQLYDYQKNTVSYCKEAIDNGHTSFIINLPTGGGKTVVFSEMARIATRNGYTVLIITDSKKLLTQTSKYFSDVTVINADSKRNMELPEGGIVISMAQTLVRRKRFLDWFNTRPGLLVIVDECHIKTSCSPLYKITNGIRIGFTATSVGKYLKELFSHVHAPVSVKDLVENGFLTRNESWLRRVVDTGSLHIKGGDFDESEQEEAFKTGLSGLVEDLSKRDYKKAMVFTSSISQADSTADYLRGNGINCAVVHSQNDDVESFYKDTDVCISVGMLTKGFDYPVVDLIILYRATTSLPLYLQMCGRGSRLSPGKEMFRVIDYGGNIRRHGLWDSDRDWSLKDEVKKAKDDDNIINGISITECSQCGYISADRFKICPSCGYEEPVPELEILETEIIKWEDVNLFSLSPTDLFNYAKETGSKRRAIGIAKRKGGDYLRAYAKAAGYKETWVYRVENNMFS